MKIFRILPVNRIISGFLIFALVHLMEGCYYYKVTRPEEPLVSSISTSQAENKYIILHSGDQAWHLTNIVIDEDAVKGEIAVLSGHEFYKSTDPDIPNRYMKNKTLNESGVINEVHIYVPETGTIDGKNISIPIKSISKIEIYDPAHGATIASWTFSMLGITAGAFGIILIIVALTKSSCPFIYVNNGTNFTFTGEIFSGATQPGLERDDYLSLPMLNGINGEYILKVSNEVNEIQYINLLELILADHEQNCSVLIDKYRKLQTIRNPIAPFEASNFDGKDIFPSINFKDTLHYIGDEKMSNKKSYEEIVLKFLRPHNSDSAKLIVRAKNSFWLDILFAKFHALFGEMYNDFAKKQESTSGNKLKDWSLDQKIPLSVYIEKNGEWNYVDYFNIAGPMALKDDILAVSLNGIDSDTIKVKLEYGFMFWEIDYAAMDFSLNEPVKISSVALKNATDEKGADVMKYLNFADKEYYIQEKSGNEARLTFNIPPKSGQQRSVILHTRGYYKILRDQQGKPDRKLLKSFRKPGRFPEYSREMFKQYQSKMN